MTKAGKSALEEQLKQLIRESVFEDDLIIDEDSHLVNDLGLDSMGYVDLIVKIELSIGIVCSSQSIKSVETFRELIKLISKELEHE
ncbi:MAG: acyl carrier protein [Bacteroidota bacterium]